MRNERIPSWLFRFHKQRLEEQQLVRYDSSSSEESISTVAVQYRIAAERDRKEKELEATVASLEAELKAAEAGDNTNCSSRQSCRKWRRESRSR